MMNGKETTRLVEVQNVPILVYGGTGAVRGHKLNMKMDDAVEDLDIFFPTAEKDGSTLIDDDFQPSPSRFTVAFLIVLSSALNCFIQYTFVSIWLIAIEAYHVDALAINMLALVFALFYIPGSILTIALYARYGLSSCIIGAAFLNLLACLLRYSSCMSSVPQVSFSLIMLGHIVAAIGSPLVLNAPSRVANDWFPKNERALAISIMTQSNYIGGGLGGLLPALQVKSVPDILPMLLSQAAVAGIVLLLSIVFTPHHSPVHAAFDAAYQVELRSHIDNSNAFDIYRQMIRDFTTMMDDTDFVHLLISFSLQVGLSWALASIIGQLIQPCGYSDDIVGQALLITSVAGTFGSFFLAYLLRSNHEKYFFVYKVLIVLTSTGCLLCFAVNRPNQDVFILLCWMFYGFTAGPLTPVTLELAAEMTYPIPADNSAALLFTVAIGVYFVCTVALTPLLRSSTSMSCSSIITPASASVCAVTALASLIAIPLKPLFKRREMAAKEHANRNMATRL